MDLCMMYLEEAEKCAESIDSVSLFESVFVEGSDVKASFNEETEKKSFGLLRKAVNAIQRIFHRIQQIISDFLDYFRLDTTERSEFKKFEEECRKNPEFANKKVTVQNWKAIQKQYDATLKEMEKTARALAKSEDEAGPNLLNTMQEKAKNVALDFSKIAGKAGTTLTIKELIHLCQQSKENAETIKEMIEFDMETTNVLEKKIGEAETKKLYKQVKKLSSKCKLVRLIAGARTKNANFMQSWQKDALLSIRKAWKDMKKNGELTKDSERLVNGAFRIAKNAGKQAISDNLADRNERRRLKRRAKELQKENDKIESMMNKPEKEKKSRKERRRDKENKEEKHDWQAEYYKAVKDGH